LVQAGPRTEDIHEAQARLEAAQAAAQFAQRQLADAELTSPCAGVIRARVLEPGEMAAPQRPAVIVAETEIKWIRAYLAETELAAVPPGAVARITIDSVADQAFEGWVGFISPVAEFTPRAVQTEDLRTSLVYEVRIFVRDPNDRLRLGMPATVRFTGEQRNGALPGASSSSAPAVAPPISSQP
jgi:HlyD family secretion protein